MGICPDCENNEDIMICGTCGEQTCDHCHTICEQCKDIICVDCEAQDFLCEKCLFKRKEENSDSDINNQSEDNKDIDSDVGSYDSEQIWTYEPYYLIRLIENLVSKKYKLKEENVKLKEENARLKQEVKKLDDCRTQYLDEIALDILEYFNDTNSIKETAKKYDMTIKETMENIIYWNNDSDGLQSAKDYKQCNLEVYGKDEDEYSEEDEDK
jgi:hypothetical protein